ncbi:MAG: hypothetical protein K2W33_05445, partial [Burkholderiales bacterium]|nr:hypothetical protein [Burkholderiales bacterium]
MLKLALAALNISVSSSHFLLLFLGLGAWPRDASTARQVTAVPLSAVAIGNWGAAADDPVPGEWGHWAHNWLLSLATASVAVGILTP